MNLISQQWGILDLSLLWGWQLHFSVAQQFLQYFTMKKQKQTVLVPEITEGGYM
jgi:hypothetical protein